MKKLFFFLFFLSFFINPSSAFAEKIRSFEVQIAAHKNGLMDITETINYDFENLDRHGIYRFIPLYSKVGDLYRVVKIENLKIERDNNPENFEKTQSKDKIDIKIGNKNKTITGTHIYKISYTVENGIGSNFLDHDEIYWNATGNNWEVPIEAAKITIATDFGVEQKDYICFTGITGSKEKDCEVSGYSASNLGILSPGEGLTAVAVYPPNTFPKSILLRSFPKTFAETIFDPILKNYYLIFIFLNFILASYLFVWYQKNKNKKRFGKPVVNFDFPEDLNKERIPPALAGTIDTAKLERDDVVATIFDLAIRKYIKLEEINKSSKVLRVINTSHREQVITKFKEDDGKLNAYEKKLFNRLFEAGKSVEVDTLKKDFYKTFEEMEKDVFKLLVEKGYYLKNPKIQRSLLLFTGLFSLFTLNIFLAGILFFLSVKLIGRTAVGDEIDFKIDGLKLFLKSMDRNYKWQAEKFYIVEQMIPYAIALGYIDKFMESLKILKPDYNPSWYAGYSGSFYTNYAGFYSNIGNNIATSAPSSSSGFSGGSSGSGSGGGGGGSW
ncbi:MAG: DUF2207 domain-containing protein [Candidatus Levybacteria bacterium]|nr:DUF2207 domain-containing protein [Candidatus Levybacteria bacterium]